MSSPSIERFGLSKDRVLSMYETMLLARKIDERMWLLNRAGKIPFVVSCQGQEGAQVGAAMALETEKDYILPYYRDLGLVLHFGMTPVDLMMQGFAKAPDPNSGGRQMPGHFGQKENRIVSGSSPVTTQLPHAAGFGLAAKMEKKDFVTLVSFGEGSASQGDFHEGANFAGIHNLPVIFFCENNKYAISVPMDKQSGSEYVSDRAAGYGMPGVTVDGNDPLAVYEAVKQAADRARNGEGPTLIETMTYRLTPHSSDDDDSFYRSKEEVEQAKQEDAVHTFSAYLKENGVLTEAGEQEMLERIKRTVDDATEQAEEAPYGTPESVLDYVYAQQDGERRWQ
ncbi:thiamine pyrophosphate-dependent dehydrogenase E1 component subunit alpha [Salibacterium halotolerans]|uniref:2-oxoisovalerate dehydrogenase subunit alpha n=1 Tax=Salibacterium halotolerans TaxID=1884432 RepID=A0A1I5NR28_9BACI|nr:thiamine pyrophosphate-dependent dehydrogenase E1 component subunit alpha [Salibacterium halotolerans]SFP24100.1 2-oxoisovalerate dehydrogenase E1 component alpha subunit [Salibacterium halotolerans]